MQTVGLSELKKHLSQYIRRVRDGQPAIVTDRGQVVAELRPPGQIPPVRRSIRRQRDW